MMISSLRGDRPKAHSCKRTAEVGSYDKIAPHPWGLCDMSGNVHQWCENIIEKQGNNRALRGGSWYSNPRFCRAADRNLFAVPGRSASRQRRLLGLCVCRL